MPIISLYNHTARRFAEGANLASDTYRLALFTSATFAATDVNLADVSGTQVANANGYATGGQALTGAAITTVTTNDARFDANDVSWNASGGSIAAAYGVLYNDTDSSDPLVAFIDFEGTQTAGDGTAFNVNWSPNGIVQFNVA